MPASRESFRFSVGQLALLLVVIAGGLTWWTRPLSAAPAKAKPIQTERHTDVAIFGRGWFVVSLPSGDSAYTRVGDLNINRDGELTAGRGPDNLLLDPSIVIPPEAMDLSIGADGVVLVRMSGQTMLTQVGQIQIARFNNPDGLRRVLPNVYAESHESGPPALVIPGEGGSGMLSQGWLESPTDPSQRRDYGQAAMIAVLGVCGWNLLEVGRLRRRVNDLVTA